MDKNMKTGRRRVHRESTLPCHTKAVKRKGRNVPNRQVADESGNITIAFVFFMVIICTLLVGIFDLSGALATRSSMENDLAAAIDETKTSSNALIVKNSDDPGKTIAEQVVKSIRQNGSNGKVSVWVSEADSSKVPEDMRAIAVWVMLEGSYEPMTMGKLLDEIGLAAVDGCYLIPYSANKAWRPATSNLTGAYVAEADSSSVTFNASSASQVPSGLAAQLQLAIDKANE